MQLIFFYITAFIVGFIFVTGFHATGAKLFGFPLMKPSSRWMMLFGALREFENCPEEDSEEEREHYFNTASSWKQTVCMLGGMLSLYLTSVAITTMILISTCGFHWGEIPFATRVVNHRGGAMVKNLVIDTKDMFSNSDTPPKHYRVYMLERPPHSKGGPYFRFLERYPRHFELVPLADMLTNLSIIFLLFSLIPFNCTPGGSILQTLYEVSARRRLPKRAKAIWDKASEWVFNGGLIVWVIYENAVFFLTVTK